MKPDSTETWGNFWKNKFIPPDQIEKTATDLRKQGYTIVTVNGSFDLMHAGHLHILFEASKQADKFIVALNTDSSIQRYKSPDRPIIPLDYRLQMISAIEWVDFVTYFDETDPRILLEKIQPDVHVNGAEYGENCIEAETVKRFKGKLHIVNILPGLSTSYIMKKIEQLLTGSRL